MAEHRVDHVWNALCLQLEPFQRREHFRHPSGMEGVGVYEGANKFLPSHITNLRPPNLDFAAHASSDEMLNELPRRALGEGRGAASGFR